MEFDFTNSSDINYGAAKLHKNDYANGAYDDGLLIRFDNTTIGHISVLMSTDAPEKESCDLR